MGNLGLLVLVTGALTPLTWVGVRALFWTGRREPWSAALVDALQPYELPIAVIVALMLGGLLASVFL